MRDAELETFQRDINLLEYAIERWGYRRLARDSTRSCHVLAHAIHHQRILVIHESEGHWVYRNVRDPQDCGTIVDFVQRRTRQEIDGVRADLRQWLQLPPLDPGRLRLPSGLPSSRRDYRAVVEAFARARALRNSAALNARGIRPETLRSPRFRGTWRVDSRGKVLFPHRDDDGLCGFEVEGRGRAVFSEGGSKTIWESARRSTDRILVVTKSAIDALSYAQLHQTEHVGYWSTGGTLGPVQAYVLDNRVGDLPPSTEIVAAVDADPAGRTLAAILSRRAAKRGLAFAVTTPGFAQGKAWNDALRLQEAKYLASRAERRTGTERVR